MPQKTKDTFAKALKAWRERQGLTQVQAAQELGVKLDTLQNWEIARTSPQGLLYNLLLEKLSPRRKGGKRG